MQHIEPPEVIRVDLAYAKEQFDRGTAVFVDVRSLDSYETSHIPGAFSIPLQEISRRSDELPRDREILLY